MAATLWPARWRSPAYRYTIEFWTKLPQLFKTITVCREYIKALNVRFLSLPPGNNTVVYVRCSCNIQVISSLLFSLKVRKRVYALYMSMFKV
jgi:hypothetical protein